MTTLKSQAQVRADAEKDELLRKRAARQAARQLANPVTEETVNLTILPLGDGKVSMGVHIEGIGDAFYEEGETLGGVPVSTALGLYERGYVNFDGAKGMLDERRKRREAAAQRALDNMDPDVRAAVHQGSQ